MSAFVRRIMARHRLTHPLAWKVALGIFFGETAFVLSVAAASLPATLQGLAPLRPAFSAQAASAPSPASQAELARSLDSLIVTLGDDAQRTALIAQLKALRDATERTPPASPAPAATTDLLGAIASGIASVETNLGDGLTPARVWAARAEAAGTELKRIVAGESGVSFGQVLAGMITTLAVWSACAFLLMYAQRRIFARHDRDARLTPNLTSVQLLLFTLRQTGPWIIALIAVILFARLMSPILGRTLGLVTAYAIVAGYVFSSICMIACSVFSTAHRRVAVWQLLARARLPLFAIGACGALGDAMANPDVMRQLGPNLAVMLSTIAILAAALCSAYFAVAFRRPVTHLIRNRPYAQRRDHQLATEALDIVASLWHIPILLIAVALVVAIIDGRGAEGDVLRPSLASAALLVVTLFASALLLHFTRRRDTRAQRRAPHLARLTRFGSTLLVLVIWLGYLRFELELWSGPVARLVKHSALTPGFQHALLAVVATVFGTWFVWIIIDTVILEALGPNSSRNKALSPGVRARTMLPLVRNAVFATVACLGAIIAAASLGINLTPLLAGAGVIGLAVGFGAKSLVTDLITGLFIIVEETISVGDWIDIDGGHAGTVIDLTIRTVRLRDGQGAVHTIPFSQIKIVKNLSRDFANAVFEVRVPFSANLDDVTRMITEVGADLSEDFRFRSEILGPVEVFGLDRFEANAVVVKGQIKTRPLQQWSITRAFNARLKLKMEAAGMEMPVQQMQLFTPQKERDAKRQRDANGKDEAEGVARMPGIIVRSRE
ncbi:mechanosensitive ion channel family protein [Caballeronia insecticola]|uniref:Small conductance mechanosensitive channel ion channel n=1 Tax=Caballeronia insecticola TaxID=758793 RepID=R4X294_9BURK|nr:mechanosensitive ion channel family protein [Caballeronia insecticola]BAN26591.1 small conductance mechanosensitive channel ion channel [Caballeronia insecticola]